MIDLIEKYFDYPDIEIYHINSMLQINQHDLSKALASVAMEQSVVKVGPVLLDVVSSEIFKKYQCYIPDCYEHPEYLNTVLGEMASPIRNTIVKLIRNQLEEFSYKEEIQKFLEKLNYGLDIDSNTVMAQ